MLSVEELQSEIASLPREDFARLAQWFAQKSWQDWDSQIQQDSADGALDFLLEEACEAKHSGNLSKL